MAYVDGFVVPVPKKKVEAYRRLAARPVKSGATMARSTSRSAWPTT